MFYSKPVYGRAYRSFSSEMVEINSDNINQWSFKKIVYRGKKPYALFVNQQGEEIMQSLQAIRFVRLRPGEENINAKLTDAQGLEIFQRANAGEPRAVLAKEFNVSEDYVSNIKNIRARIGITLDYLNGSKKVEPAKATVASRNKNKKLSPALANFIRSDNKSLRMNVKQLAKKYCVSDRTIQRILKGEMYSNNTTKD